MFGANAFAWPYPAEAYVAGGSGGTAKTDTDGFSLDDQDKNPKRTHNPQAVDVAISASDSFTNAAGVPSIGVAASDRASNSETAAPDAQGPSPSDVQSITSTDLVAALTAAITGTDAFAFTESPEAVVVSSNVSVNDGDSGNLSETGTTSSGGVGSSFLGVVIAFGNNALDTSPNWTRIDDPAGLS